MLIKNIKLLAGLHRESRFLRGKEMAALPAIPEAYLRIEGEHIVDFGPMTSLAHADDPGYDAGGGILLPAWCDSHTHLVFAGSREQEFVDKIRGLSYAEIARRGGGILHSARLLQQTPEDVLFQQAMDRLAQISRLGTGAVEIKSGYGLTPDAELKMLRVIKRLKSASDLHIKATFLGAHAYPPPFRHDHEGYIRQITEEMLPQIAQEGLADYIDVFCEKGFFSLRESRRILTAGQRYGLQVKMHANQLNDFGAVELGVELSALSVDHLEHLGPAAMQSLAASTTIPTLLPTAAFFLRLPYPPARTMIDAGLGLALATDYNPGSSPSGNIPLLFSMSCIQMRMLPEEAINALTINGACAMQVEDELGNIAVGKRANLIISKPAPSLAYLPYSFGENWIRQVIIGGQLVPGV